MGCTFRLVGVALAVGILASCQSAPDNPKQTGGTLVGAVLGGLIGSQFGSRSGKLAATAIGTLAGAWIGSKAGAYLDEKDRQTAAASAQAAVSTGQSQSWRNPDSGVSGRADITSQQTRSGTMHVAVQKDLVDEIPPIDVIGESYAPSSSVNVRGGPGTEYRVVGSIASGEIVHVVGEVQGKDWYLISHRGVATGFVSANLLKPAAARPDTLVASTATAPSDHTATAVVSATRLCRTVTQTVTLADGSHRQDQVTACRGPNGWEIQQT